MKARGAPSLMDVCEATWPPASVRQVAGWVIREGSGGGKRVSAATAERPGEVPDIAEAERAMRALGQDPLFMIRKGEEALDRELEARGYDLVDPVNVYACPVGTLAAERPPRLAAFTLYPPLAAMKELWAAGGIGPARLAVMDRAHLPRTAIMGRAGDRVAGVAFVAIHGDTAMLHALEVDPVQRRQKVAVNIMRAAAFWAQDHGAKAFSVLVTQQNGAANALYSSLNMQVVEYYHYRKKTAQGRPRQAS